MSFYYNTKSDRGNLRCLFSDFSGCCCDTRKAVFVVNIISMSFYGYGLMIVSALWAGIRAINNGQITYDDDAMNNAISEMSEMDGTSYGLVVALFTIGIVCNGIAIYGASNFNKISVLIGGMWCVVEAVRSLAYLNLGGAFMAACFAYPHFVFYWEMKQGIMTRESYPQEKHCCEC